MSHTSQRRGLDPAHPNQEFIVLAMARSDCKELQGVKTAMSELAVTMLKHEPDNWISKNFSVLDIPELPVPRKFFEWLEKLFPSRGKEIIMRLTGLESQVITALYTDRAKVTSLIREITGDWLSRNRKKGYPISLVLSALAEEGHACCRETGLTEHSFLHSLGFFGKIHDMPSEDELALITMCGHGLISVHRIRYLVQRIRSGDITPMEAGEDIAKPCVCGIVNPERAKTVFQGLASAQPGRR